MTTRRTVGRILALGVTVLLLTLLVGHLLGAPVLFAYVETGSMSPTLEPGDGYVAIPAELAGPVEEGDVVTFRAREVHGGELTTHRVVGETEHGYLTRGDANPFLDQDGGEPHVTDGQIVAVAWQFNGEVVAVPHVGTAVMGAESAVRSAQARLARTLGMPRLAGSRGVPYVLAGFGSMLLLAALLLDRGGVERTYRRTRTREDVLHGGKVLLGVALLLCVVTAGTMFVGSGAQEAGVVSAEFDSDRPDVIPRGETKVWEYDLRNDGVLPTVVVMESASDGVEVRSDTVRLERGERATAEVVVAAPDETGYYLRSVATYRYLAVLPRSVILSLHAVHPWAAVAGVTATVVGAVMLPLFFVFGTGPVRTARRRSRNRTRGS